MDIRSGCGYPACKLSNFYPHPFVIDDVKCNSMEGFLQSLKFENPDIQIEICKLVGYAAKKRGRKKDWRKTQTLWWRGKEIDRHSKEYQNLLDRAYKQLFENCSFRRALKATQNSVLKHSIGKNNSRETILTQTEFCSRLMKLRKLIE